jgi:hypothetical protein
VDEGREERCHHCPMGECGNAVSTILGNDRKTDEYRHVFFGEDEVRKRIVFICTLLFAAVATTQATADHLWRSRAPMPEVVEGTCDGVIGNKIYIAFGFSNGDSSRLRIYDIDTNTWSFGPAAPTAGRSEFYQGVAHGDRLYCLGGRSTTESWVFDVAMNTWESLTPSPDRRTGAAQDNVGNNIYAFGGREGSSPCSSSAKRTILRYDIDKDAWSPAGRLQVPRSDATATERGGRIYIFGGCDTDTYYDTVEVYNPRTQTSTLLSATMPGGPRADLASAYGGSNTIRVTGGHNDFAPVQPNHVIFNVSKKQFTVGTAMPTAPCSPGHRGEHDLVYKGGRIYAIGGACPALGTSIDRVDMLKLNP